MPEIISKLYCRQIEYLDYILEDKMQIFVLSESIFFVERLFPNQLQNTKYMFRKLRMKQMKKNLLRKFHVM